MSFQSNKHKHKKHDYSFVKKKNVDMNLWSQDKNSNNYNKSKEKSDINYKHIHKKHKHFELNINKKLFYEENFEYVNKRVFRVKLYTFLDTLEMNEEVLILTKIQIQEELHKANSKHFDTKEFTALIEKFISLN